MAGYDDGVFANLPRPKLKGRVAATPDPGQPLTPAVQAVRPQQSAQPGPEPSYADQLAQWLYAKGTANLPASAEPGLRNTLEGAANLYNQWTPTGSFEGGVRQGMQGNAAGFVGGILGAAPIPGAPAGKIAAKGAEEAVEGAAEAAAKSGITAYHGSPYSFDRFDISKIGTGEGAQAYGHGLYFAENEDTARSYRDALTQGKWTYGDQPVSQSWDASALDYLDQRVAREKGVPAAIDEAIGRLKNSSDFYNKTYASGGGGSNLYDSAIARLQRLDPSQVKPAGSMYQVNINADPEQFLDWDKPLSQQPQAVQDFVANHPQARRLQGNDMVGGQLTEPTGQAIIQRLGKGSEAAQSLADAGVPGIKYLDQGSRGAGGEGTSNYVTFSDDTIDILRKYGLAGLGLTAGAGALSVSGQSPVSSPAEAAPSTFPPPQGMTFGAQPNWSP